MGMGTDLLEKPEVQDPDLDQGEGLLTHIVIPKDAVTNAYITGEPVTALCGYTWVPSRDPSKYPVCEQCKEIYGDPGNLS